MNKFLLSANIVITVLLLSACSGRSKTSSSLNGGDTLEIKYARNITIISFKDYKVAALRNPWDTTKVLHTYILVDKNKPMPKELSEGSIVRTPVSKAVVYSSVHSSLFNDLGAFSSIAGVCDLKYIKLSKIQEACKRGAIIDVGDGMSPDIEKIIDLHPDALLLSPFENSGGYGRVDKLGVPIIECADYMETSALGRAEWMKFYGLLTGKEAEADSIFTEVESRYNSLAKQALSCKDKPTVITELKNSSTWYIPGGNSTSAKLFHDAGAKYIFANDNHSGSVPMSFESVFEKGENADFWLIKYNQVKEKNYRELKEEYSPYANFAAFKNKKIYGCNTNSIPYYEESPFHPEQLLADLIKIFHPELTKGYELKYFSKLAD